MTNCVAFSVVVAEVDVDGNAIGNTLKSSAAEIERRTVVKRLQQIVEIQTKPLAPFSLFKEAVPAVIEIRTRGKTIKIPNLRVKLAIKFIV